MRHLLNQTGGLSETSGRIPLADFDDGPGATERQARALATLPIDRPVGSAFEYSNANYNLLGLIAEAAGGQSYADYVQTHIFTPLHMEHSYTAPAPAAEDGMAVGHRYWFAAPVAAPDLPVPYGSLPSGQLIASAEDMGRYMIAQLNDGRYQNAQLLSPEGVAAMHRGEAEYVEMGVSFGKYGMGWFDDEIDGTRLLWHSGIVPHSFAYMALLPEQKKGVVLLGNAYNYLMTPALTEMGAGVAALLAGEQPPPSQFGFMPWVQRGLLLIPLLQLVGGVTSLRRLRRWDGRGGGRLGWRFLLPLLLTLLPTLTLIPLLGAMRGFWLLFMPDYSWIAIISGGVAGIWVFLGAGLAKGVDR